MGVEEDTTGVEDTMELLEATELLGAHMELLEATEVLGATMEVADEVVARNIEARPRS